MESETLFISCGANTTPGGILWLDKISLNGVNESSRYLAYASHHMIALVNFTKKRLDYTFIGHTGQVSTITSYQNPLNNSIEIISSGEDGTVIVWRHYLNDPIHNWSIVEKLSNLQGSSITCHSTLATDLGVLLCASNSKAKLVTWFRSNNEESFSVLEEINVPPAQMPKAINLMNCPTHGSDKIPSVILSLGSVDSRVHLRLYNINRTNEIFGFCGSTPIGLLTGHEDWVTCLSESFYLHHHASDQSTNLFFASGSQDSKIRIWKIIPSTVTLENDPKTQSQPQYEETNEIEDEEDEAEEDEGEGESKAAVGVVSEENTGEARCAFIASQVSDCHDTELILFSVTLETLLVGHEDWITSLHWMAPDRTIQHSNSNELSLRLFSTSMDRNMVVWAPDPMDGIWSPVIRIGDIGGNLGGSVGGNLLGFVGGCTMITEGTLANGQMKEIESILGVGFGGSFHLWQRAIKTSAADSEMWRPQTFLTGHFGAVTDVIWSNCPDDTSSITNNEFILSVSVDQTCRLFAPNVSGTDGQQQHLSWSELSRPQIHGYNLSSIQLLPFDSSPFTFFSAGDEKAIRSFEAPTVVLEGLTSLAHNNAAKHLLEVNDSGKRVQSAYIPELGLSNRAANLMTGDELKEQASRGVDTIQWNTSPLEGQLADKTIWPEIDKLHGHTGDVVCLSASSCGTWLASAAKGRDTKSSAVLIWELKRMVCVANLLGHESTVTALSFSPNSRFLASGGKDRSLLIHECAYLDQDPATARHQHSFTPRAFLKNAHKRIIWDLTWIGESSELLATASRDGTVKVWKVSSSQHQQQEGSGAVDSTNVLSLLWTFSPFDGIAVTSIDSTLRVRSVNGTVGWLLIVGAENGNMQIWMLSSTAAPPCHLHSISSNHIHGATVSKIKWKESCHSEDLKFASCGEDHSVRVFRCTL